MKHLKINILNLLLLLFFTQCKDADTKVNTVSDPLKENPTKNHTIKELQGIWRGYKDSNQSTSFRIQNEYKILDLVCIEGNCLDLNKDHLSLEESYLGFVSSSKVTITDPASVQKTEHIYPEGDILVKFNTTMLFDNTFKIDNKHYTTYLLPAYLKDSISHDFSKIQALPIDIFKALKAHTKKGKDYIKDYNLSKISSKIEITQPKAYFHTDTTENSKQKTHLTKGDVAYLEAISEDWYKVYFDGAEVTSGFIKKTNAVILN